MKIEKLLQPGLLIPIAAVVFIALGIVIAIVRSSISKKTQAKRELWVKGAYSIWTGGEDSGSWAAARAQSALRDWYGVSNSGGFWDVIKELKQGQTGNAAWDRVRALDILRIGRAAGYIDDDQCWGEASTIGLELQRLYRSWEDLARAFEAGMNEWQHRRGVSDPQQTGRVQRNLPTLRQLIWPQVAYDTSLAIDD
ncbi:MAG: DUF1266 domain-containing protein [Polyangiaceae bacterium]